MSTSQVIKHYQIYVNVAKKKIENVQQNVSSGLDVGLMAEVFSGLEVIFGSLKLGYLDIWESKVGIL